MKPIDLTGKKFGRLKCIRDCGRIGRGRGWECLCDCGKKVRVLGTLVKSGALKSCGCLKLEGTRRRHMDTLTPEHNTWIGIRRRCLSKQVKSYKYYGARGISISADWDKYENFLRDMGRRPSPLHSIDRIDPNGNYCKENCRWATREVQNTNKRFKAPKHKFAHVYVRYTKTLGPKYFALVGGSKASKLVPGTYASAEEAHAARLRFIAGEAT